MLSFFSRKPFNSKIKYYDTKLSKYVIDTTNKVKKKNLIVPYTNKVIEEQSISKLMPSSNNFTPIITILWILAGYYFSKYNI